MFVEILLLFLLVVQGVVCWPALSAVSWGPNSIDVVGVKTIKWIDFGSEVASSVLWHRYLESSDNTWYPKTKFHSLGNTTGLAFHALNAPTISSWQQGRLDVFAVEEGGTTWHKYADSSDWYPKGSLEKLVKDGGNSFRSPLTSASWGPNRIDVVGLKLDSNDDEETFGTYVHLYWDGSSWKGWESVWGEDVKFQSPPAIVSMRENRFDVFGVDVDGQVQHQYWDTDHYLDSWETLKAPTCDDGGDDEDEHQRVLMRFRNSSRSNSCVEPEGFREGSLTASSWSSTRLDVWAIGNVGGQLWHAYWEGSEYHDWELLGCNPLTEGCDNPVFEDAPQVVHWSEGRIDIVAFSGYEGDPYWHKYGWWDGSNWNWKPSAEGWESMGGNFSSQPAVTTWGQDNFNVLGVDVDGVLQWQSWNVTGWLPAYQNWTAIGDINEIKMPASPPDGLTKQELRR